MRERLPDRRRAELLDFIHSGRRWTAAISRFDDGRIAEVFLNSEKDSAVADLARESAIIASIALQFGANVSTIRHAIESTSAGPRSARSIWPTGALNDPPRLTTGSQEVVSSSGRR